jgi:hypothetical protein
MFYMIGSDIPCLCNQYNLYNSYNGNSTLKNLDFKPKNRGVFIKRFRSIMQKVPFNYAKGSVQLCKRFRSIMQVSKKPFI